MLIRNGTITGSIGAAVLVAGVAGFIDAMAGGSGLLTLPALLAAGAADSSSGDQQTAKLLW